MLLRKQIYTLLIFVSAGLMFGRIIAVDRADVQQLEQLRLRQIPQVLQEKRERLERENRDPARIDAEMARTEAELRRNAALASPLFCANDRSRWCTIRALVEPDMRVVREKRIIYDLEPGMPPPEPVYETVWYAIDKVQNEKGWDTIDMVKHTLPDDPNGPGYLYSSKPPLLVTLMAVPYAVIYHGSGGRLSLGNETYALVRTLLVVINLIPLLLAWVALSRLIERYGTTDWGRVFAMAVACFGTFLSTFVVTLNNHLPAAVCTTFAVHALSRLLDGPRHPRLHALLLGLFASLLVVCEMPGVFFAAMLVAWFFFRDPKRCALYTLPVCVLLAAAFLGTNFLAHRTVVPPYAFKGDAKNNWYVYTYEREGRERASYWSRPVGVDLGEPSRAVYAFHGTFGHHGIFSLTPVWILAVWGGMIRLGGRKSDPRTAELAAAFLSISVLIFLFYLFRDQENRNYGGITSALRWTFWLVPLWTLLVVPAADRLSTSKIGRGFALLLLAASCLSAAYPVWTPWTMPWIYHLLRWCGVATI